MGKFLDFAGYWQQLVVNWQLATGTQILIIVWYGSTGSTRPVGQTVVYGQIDIGWHLKRIVVFHNDHPLRRRVFGVVSLKQPNRKL